MEDTAVVQEVVFCDPTIEDCGFKNTIELDYATPNAMVAITGILSLVGPWAMNRFYVAYDSYTDLQKTDFNNGGLG